MKLTLERIGAVKSASIELAGLTVLAGENDTGKSTIGKVAFALVQAFSTFPVAFNAGSKNRLRREVELAYFRLRRNVNVMEFASVRGLFNQLRIRPTEALNLEFSDVERIVREADGANTEPAELDRVLGEVHSIWRGIDRIKSEMRDSSESEVLGKMIHRALKSEFAGNIQHAPRTVPAKISLTDGATAVLEISVEDRGVVEFVGGEPLGLRDATLVDGPAILQFYPALGGFDGLNVTGKSSHLNAIPYHVADLARKLKQAGVGLKDGGSVGFGGVYDGDFIYDDSRDNFYLRRGDVAIPSVNVASGIKALSIIEILCRGDYVSDDTLLILDEPETNLHPAWQIAYARIICDLAARGAKILVTTHSPYMLEALKGYVSSEVESKFYLAKRLQDGICYVDTLGDISPIIETLSSPLLRLLDEVGGGDI
jgi:predicted ATPase